MARFDCQSCGACCCNTERNRYAGNREYIEVTKSERLYRQERELLRSIGFRDERGLWHLRLVGDEQRCVALDGEVGRKVACSIYPLRPVGCKNVQPGDEECLRARQTKLTAAASGRTS